MIPEVSSFKKRKNILGTTININAKKMTCITGCTPESSNIHKYTMCTFFTEFEYLLIHYILTKDDLIIISDFNFHINKPDIKTKCDENDGASRYILI